MSVRRPCRARRAHGRAQRENSVLCPEARALRSRGARRAARAALRRRAPGTAGEPGALPGAVGVRAVVWPRRGARALSRRRGGRRPALATRVFSVWEVRRVALSVRISSRRAAGAAGRAGSRSGSRLGSFCVETVRVCLCTLGLRRLARMIRFFAVTDHFLNRQGKLKPNSTSGPRSRTSKRTSQTHTRHQKQTPQRSLICKSTHAHPRRELWSVPSLLDECSERP